MCQSRINSEPNRASRFHVRRSSSVRPYCCRPSRPFRSSSCCSRKRTVCRLCRRSSSWPSGWLCQLSCSTPCPCLHRKTWPAPPRFLYADPSCVHSRHMPTFPRSFPNLPLPVVPASVERLVVVRCSVARSAETRQPPRGSSGLRSFGFSFFHLYCVLFFVVGVGSTSHAVTALDRKQGWEGSDFRGEECGRSLSESQRSHSVRQQRRAPYEAQSARTRGESRAHTFPRNIFRRELPTTRSTCAWRRNSNRHAKSGGADSPRATKLRPPLSGSRVGSSCGA